MPNTVWLLHLKAYSLILSLTSEKVILKKTPKGTKVEYKTKYFLLVENSIKQKIVT